MSKNKMRLKVKGREQMEVSEDGARVQINAGKGSHPAARMEMVLCMSTGQYMLAMTVGDKMVCACLARARATRAPHIFSHCLVAEPAV